jgi:hypothetical protein
VKPSLIPKITVSFKIAKWVEDHSYFARK